MTSTAWMREPGVRAFLYEDWEDEDNDNIMELDLPYILRNYKFTTDLDLEVERIVFFKNGINEDFEMPSTYKVFDRKYFAMQYYSALRECIGDLTKKIKKSAPSRINEYDDAAMYIATTDLDDLIYDLRAAHKIYLS